MKAIYINLDPYLAAFAAWLKAGKPGTAPSFDPLPLAVTIPLGESAAIYIVGDCADGESVCEPQAVTVDGLELSVFTAGTDDCGIPGAIAYLCTPALSVLAPALKYAVVPVSGDSTATAINVTDGEIEQITIPFTVLVRRETASGPVDLVDFTPPAAAPSAADIKSALVEAGAKALAGVSIEDTKWGDTSLTVAAADSGDINTLVGYLAASD